MPPRTLALVALLVVTANVQTADPPAESLPAAAVMRVGSTRFRVGAGVRGIAYSADGKRLFSAGNDGYFRVWDALTGRETNKWPSSDGGVSSLRLSPDGKRLASAGSNGMTTIWDAATGEKKVALQSQSHGDTYLAWSNDGKRLVAAGREYVRVIDSEAGTELINWQVQFRFRQIAGVAVSPDDKQIVVIGYEGELKAWDFDGKETTKYEPPDRTTTPIYGTNRGLTFSPDGQWLAAAAMGRSLALWDAKTGAVGLRIEAGSINVPINTTAVAFSPNSRFVAAAGAEGRVRVFGLASSRELRSFDVGRIGISTVMFSPDGKQLLAAGNAPALFLWDVATGKSLSEDSGHRNAITNLAFLADGRLVSMGADNTVRCWDVSAGKEIDRLTPSYLPGNALAADPDGKSVIYMASGTRGYGLHRWVPGSGTTQLDGPSMVSNNAHLSPDGRFAVVHRGNALQPIDLVADKELRTLGFTRSHPNAFAISPDGRTLAFHESVNQGRLALWDTATGKDRDLARGNPEYHLSISRLVFTPDSRTVAASMGNAFRFWEVATGLVRLRLTMPPNQMPVSIAFSRDGRLAAVGGSTGSVRLFDAVAGTDLGAAELHQGSVSSLAFSWDGTRLASGGADSTLVVWDVAKLARDRLPKPQGGEATAGQLNDWWNDLGLNEGNRANIAVWRLSEAPADKVVAMARERLKPTDRPSREQVTKWIKDLDDDKFAVRNRAARALAAAGDDIKPTLEDAMKQSTSDEVRTQIDKILKTLESGMSATRLRPVRAVEVLDRLGTPAARKLLEEMAAQSYGDEVQRELNRLLKRVPDEKP